MHRQASPLTVFTKSYCPYSRRATNRLRSFGARFDEFVVDLRDDASGLQSALREVSGHRTVSVLGRRAPRNLSALLTQQLVPPPPHPFSSPRYSWVMSSWEAATISRDYIRRML